jgi:hypothetical protein
MQGLPASRSRAARHAGRLRGDVDAPGLEVGERDAVTHAFLRKQILGGHPAVLEHDLRGVRGALPGFFLDARDNVARGLRRHEEGADTALACFLRRYGEDHRNVGIFPRGDELLHAVQHVMRALPLGARGNRAGVGTHVRLGQGERAEDFAFCEGTQKSIFLRFVTVTGHNPGHEVIDGDDGCGGAIAGGDLLAGDGKRAVVEARAAPFLLDRDAV